MLQPFRHVDLDYQNVEWIIKTYIKSTKTSRKQLFYGQQRNRTRICGRHHRVHQCTLVDTFFNNWHVGLWCVGRDTVLVQISDRSKLSNLPDITTV